MRCQSRRFYLLIALLCTSFVAMGQSKLADFDGTWKLNAAKSDGGPRPLAEGMMVKWTSNDAEFDVHHQMPNGEMLLKLRSDGKEVVNRMPNGVGMKSTHRIESGVLVGEYRIHTERAEMTQLDRISLSADGKTMTTDREYKTPQGGFRQKLVFDRQ